MVALPCAAHGITIVFSGKRHGDNDKGDLFRISSVQRIPYLGLTQDKELFIPVRVNHSRNNFTQFGVWHLNWRQSPSFG